MRLIPGKMDSRVRENDKMVNDQELKRRNSNALILLDAFSGRVKMRPYPMGLPNLLRPKCRRFRHFLYFIGFWGGRNNDPFGYYGHAAF
jgi:hypothetical protein